ncbi:MAG: sulfatase [Solirubrobacterales bacterium]
MRAATAAAALAAGAVLLALLGPGSGAADPAPAQAARTAQGQPNVVVIMSDDQTVDEMRFMPATERLIGGAGATFTDSVVNWPLCCPARATFLTGQYAHNHRVRGNAPPQGGFEQLNIDRTLPVWLQRAGYWTGYVGKFLNGYESSDVGVPPGWSDWHGSKLTYWYYGYKLLEAGRTVTYGSADEDPDDPRDPGSYSTDVFTDKAVDAIAARAPSEQPFFLSVNYLAPHEGAPNGGRCGGAAKPAPRHAGLLDEEPLPLPPSFNEEDVADKPRQIRKLEPMTPEQIEHTTTVYRCRAESLLAIDEGVERIVEQLRDTGELRNTIVVYTSDNGFFHGEHRLSGGKNRVYEEAVRVPLLMRGPGIPRGTEVGDQVVNADLAPTIVDAAGAKAGLPPDGVSLLPFARHPDRLHGREVLIEQDTPELDNGNPRGTEYQAVRTNRYKFVRYWDDQVELYDLRHDPYELDNLRRDPDYGAVKRALSERLERIGDCAGKSCRTKPAMKLKLSDPVRRDGIRCHKPGDLTARVKRPGEDPSDSLVRASFRVDGSPSGTVRSAPFARKLNSRLLRERRKPLIEVDAELLDGRILTLHERVRACR